VAALPDSDKGRHDDRGLGGLLPGRHRPGCNGAGGDDILGPGAGSITRAITIDVPADQVWPWLAQLGYGRAC
jgi:hypothetical protein